MPPENDPEFLTIDEACAVVGGNGRPISRPTYYRGVRSGLYEAPVRVGPNTSRVPGRRLRARMSALVAARDEVS